MDERIPIITPVDRSLAIVANARRVRARIARARRQLRAARHAHLSGGSSDSFTEELRVTIRTKLSGRILPREKPVGITIGALPPKACDACGLDGKLDGNKVNEYDVALPDGRTLRFHHLCLTIWHEERLGYPLP